ncbi:hypothetical protein [Sphingomonas glaciei]|uniref:SGNH/GDSL hydrolase family protein n=1 Tax=Sphingomonas glaciei TaxID=2938948 RepID=A0ABY5MUE2_9SPHN|nr:hypothetical protein [Sphingomonas glaciei]UUR06947.1 hypothetical protein M1K48_08240 [Sphingomonas glaciei]
MRDRLARFAPFAAVGAILSGWLVAINLSFAALNDSRLLSWIPDRTSGIGYLLESKQRVTSAEQVVRSSRAEAGRDLIAVVGISDVREGTRLDVLSSKAGACRRFLGIAGAGAGFASVKEQASLILNSSLRPKIVLLGISPMQMIEASDLERGAAATAQAGAAGMVGNAKAAIRESLWFVQRRSDLVGWLDRVLLEGRGDIDAALGQEAAIDPRSPWRPLLRTLGVEHYPDGVLRDSLAVVRGSGATNVATYERSRRSFDEAGELIRQFQARGATVMVMFMPRHPWLESSLPPQIDPLIASRLRGASANPALQVLDYSNLVPAQGFIDLVHLNTAGGQTFSDRLAADLPRLSPGRQDGVEACGKFPAEVAPANR